MPYYKDWVQDTQGDIIQGAVVTVTKVDGTAATLYSNAARTSTTSSVSGSDGSFAFYIAPGRYNVSVNASNFTASKTIDLSLPAENLLYDLGAVGDGVTDDRSAVAAADAVGPFNISAGNYSIGSNLTITNDVEFLKGAKFTIPAGVTVTFSGNVRGPREQIFVVGTNGLQTVFARGAGDIYPEWYGADPSGTADSASALNYVGQAARISLATQSLNGVSRAYLWGVVVSCCPNAVYKCLSSVWWGWNLTLNGVTMSNRCVPIVKGNGATIYGVHTDYILDLTGGQYIQIDDLALHGDSVTIPKAGLFAARRDHNISAARRYIRNLSIAGSYSIAGYICYGVEEEDHYAWDFALDAGMAVICTETGRWWDGANWQTLSAPNADAGNTLGVESNITHYWNRCRFVHLKTAPSGIQAMMQLIGFKDTKIDSCFFQCTGADAPGIQTIQDQGGSGTVPTGLAIVGATAFHQTWPACVQVNGTLAHLQVDNAVRVGTLTSSFIFGTAANTVSSVTNQAIIRNSTLHVPSIDMSAANCDMTRDNVVVLNEASGLGTISIARQASGLFMFPATATRTFSGNNFFKNGRVIETDTGRSYRISDVIDNSNVSTSAGGEDNLQTYTASANGGISMLSSTNGLEIQAAGVKTGAAGNKTINFYFGAQSWTVHPAANNQLNWMFKASIFNVGTSDAQRGTLEFYNDSTLVYSNYVTSAVASSSNVTIRLTGTCANAADAIIQTMWRVRYI